MSRKITTLVVLSGISLVVLQGIWPFPLVATRVAACRNSPNPSPSPAVQTLDPGVPLEREMKGGESHTYLLTLKADDYLKLVVEQKGIDVVVRLIGPDGKVVATVDSPTGTQGPEFLSAIIENAGGYRVEVVSLEKTALPAKYEVKIEALRPATEQDQVEFEVETLLQKGENLYQAGKYDDGLPLATLALEKSERTFGTEHGLVASSLKLLASLYKAKGDYRRAEPLSLRALSIWEKALGPEHQMVATGLNNLGLLYTAKGAYSKAEPLYQRSLAIREKILGAEHPLVAASLNNLAVLYYTEGDYTQAEVLFRQALPIYEKTLGPEHEKVANTLNNLAAVYNATGDLPRSEALYQRSLDICEKTLGTEHPDVARMLNNLAELYREKGDYAKAENYFQQSLGIIEKTLGMGHWAYAQNLNNQAVLFLEKSDFTKAEKLLQQALAIREKALGAGHPQVAETLNNLGMLYLNQGNPSKAEALYQRSLDIYQKALGLRHPDVALSLNSLACLYSAKGDYPQAELFHQKALAILEKTMGREHPDVARTLNNLASVYVAKGNYSQAEPLYHRALAILEKIYGSEHLDVVINLRQQAWLYQAKSDLPQAVACLSRSNAIIERDLCRNLITGSEHQKLLYLSKILFGVDQTLSLQAKAGTQNTTALLREAVTLVLQRKGRALDAMTNILAALRRQASPQDQKLLDELGILRSQISVLTLRGSGKEGKEKYRTNLMELQDKADQLESALSARSAEFKVQTIPITLDAIQKAIPSDTALVEFAFYHPFNPQAGTFEKSRFIAYVLKSNGDPLWADLGEATPIKEAAVAFIQSLRRPTTNDRPLPPEPNRNLTRLERLQHLKPENPNVRQLGQKLEALVFQPVRKLLGETTRVLLSPDTILNLIPFNALVDDKGKYLVETYEFSYLTSGRDLLRLQNGIQSEQPPLIVANPNYGPGKGPQLLGRQFLPLTRLAGTTIEAQQLKAMYPESSIFLDHKATKTVLTSAHRPQFVHIGTHGYFFQDVPLEDSPDTDVNPASVTQRGTHSVNLETFKQNTGFLRSCLFFAGANTTGEETGDGVMTALEASTLDLWGTKLVVLSACDTGLGEVKSGDGVYGLRRALVLAGSESQMVSLWSVSDIGTRELMIAYYRRLKAGEGRSEALRNVQLSMLKNPKRHHPFYWASFILSGEWGNLEGKR